MLSHGFVVCMGAEGLPHTHIDSHFDGSVVQPVVVASSHAHNKQVPGMERAPENHK